MKGLIFIFFALVLAAALGCNAGGDGSGATMGELAVSGQAVFSNSCSSCHGSSGQGGSGPALIGENSVIFDHDDADELLEHIEATMPLGAPGSLTGNQYQGVLCYLLIENDVSTEDTVFDASGLSQISLIR